MGEKKSNTVSTIWLTILTIVLIAVVTVVILAAKAVKENPALYELMQPQVAESETVMNDSITFVPFTVEEAVNSFIEEKEIEECYNRYIQLEPVVVKAIYTKIGTLATIQEFMKEYDKNKSYYLALQAADQIKQVRMNGPDADKVKLNVFATVDTTVVEKTVKVNPAYTKLQE